MLNLHILFTKFNINILLDYVIEQTTNVQASILLYLPSSVSPEQEYCCSKPCTANIDYLYI